MSKVTDEQTQLSDRDWWQEAGNHLNLELHGWTFRNNASFIDRETRQYVPLTGAIAARLIALEAASSTPDGEVVAWRVRERPGFDWRFIDGDPDRDFSLNGYEKQPLYTHPSHNAGEIEAGGEVGEPTRYDMVKMTGSLTLLPAVRADGEWVRYADHEASIASAIACFDHLAATQNGIVHQITARAEAADKRIAELEAAIRGLLRSEYESAEPGLTDCIDNTGTPYQSQYLADQIKLAEAALKESRL